jgi:hypothetical protein
MLRCGGLVYHGLKTNPSGGPLQHTQNGEQVVGSFQFSASGHSSGGYPSYAISILLWHSGTCSAPRSLNNFQLFQFERSSIINT